MTGEKNIIGHHSRDTGTTYLELEVLRTNQYHDTKNTKQGNIHKHIALTSRLLNKRAIW